MAFLARAAAGAQLTRPQDPQFDTDGQGISDHARSGRAIATADATTNATGARAHATHLPPRHA